MMTEAETPLTALCAICHINPLKYTCPRCHIHTCSLPCVKLHKTRAQCSGIRNPAEYRKRSELATESSVDKDFNFITSLERGVKKAGEDVTEKRIDLRPALMQGNHKGNIGLERAAEERGMRLVRAPLGLSKRKDNKSKVLWKEGYLMWTVEWIRMNGQRRLQNFDERKTVGDAYFACFGKKGFGRKRKRGQEEVETCKDEEIKAEDTQVPRGADASPGEPTINQIQQEPPSMPNASNRTEGMNLENSSSREAESKTLNHLQFYLYRPQTSSRIKCLIPISPADTIKDTLKGKRIVEFPTIYVRDEAPDALSEPFVLEKVYLEQHGEDISVPAQPKLFFDLAVTPDSPPLDSVDSQKVLEVLKHDLISV
jgi:HIT zinc finger